MPEDVKSWQYKAWALLETTQWEILISAFISLNTIVLMMEVCQFFKYFCILIVFSVVFCRIGLYSCFYFMNILPRIAFSNLMNGY